MMSTAANTTGAATTTTYPSMGMMASSIHHPTSQQQQMTTTTAHGGATSTMAPSMTTYSNPLGTPSTIQAAQQQHFQGPISTAAGAAGSSSISAAIARYPGATTTTTSSPYPTSGVSAMIAPMAGGHTFNVGGNNMDHTGGAASSMMNNNNNASSVTPAIGHFNIQPMDVTGATRPSTNYQTTTTAVYPSGPSTTFPGTSSISMAPAVAHHQISQAGGGAMPLMASYPGGTTSSSINMTTSSTPIQMAIQAGKIYSPPSCHYVPGVAMTKSGMQTIYDSHVVPTFESNLIFSVGQMTGGSQMPIHEIAHRGVTENSKPLVIARAQKNACC